MISIHSASDDSNFRIAAEVRKRARALQEEVEALIKERFHRGCGLCSPCGRRKNFGRLGNCTVGCNMLQGITVEAGEGDKALEGGSAWVVNSSGLHVGKLMPRMEELDAMLPSSRVQHV